MILERGCTGTGLVGLRLLPFVEGGEHHFRAEFNGGRGAEGWGGGVGGPDGGEGASSPLPSV